MFVLKEQKNNKDPKKGGVAVKKTNKLQGFSRLNLGLIIIAVLFLLPINAMSAEELDIAVVSAISGPVGVIGMSQLEGAKVAAMHINEDGGILGRKVNIIARDTAASPATAVKVTNEIFMKKEADFLVGVVSSAVALAIAPIVEKNDGVLILSAAQSEKATGPQCSPNVFRITTNSVAVARAAAHHMVKQYPNIKRWAFINPDYEWGHGCFDIFTKELQRIKPDVEIVAEEWPKFRADNFEPNILKIMDAKPEGLYSSLYAQDFITFVKQANNYKLFDNITGFMNHGIAAEVAIPLGKEMCDVWGGGHYHQDAYNNALNDRFLKGHRAMFGKDPVFASSESYTAVYALKHAIEQVKSFDVDKVILGLEGLEMDSVTGKRYIRPHDHQTIRSQLFTHFVPTKEDPGWTITEHATPYSEEIYPKPGEEKYDCTRIDDLRK